MQNIKKNSKNSKDGGKYDPGGNVLSKHCGNVLEKTTSLIEEIFSYACFYFEKAWNEWKNFLKFFFRGSGTWKM